MTDVERTNAAAVEKELDNANSRIFAAIEERDKLESLLAQGLYGHMVGDVVTLENATYAGRKMTVESIWYVQDHPFENEHLIRVYGTIFDGKMEIQFEQHYPRFNNGEPS